MKNSRLFFVFFLQFICFFCASIAQENYTKNPYGTPYWGYTGIGSTDPRPTLSHSNTLTSFPQSQTNPFSGSANITVPLVSIPLYSNNYNLSLSYNTGGIKVNQQADWVGLGWGLENLGYVTRVVQGTDDFESQNGYVRGHTLPSFLNNPTSSPCSLTFVDKSVFFDYQPDIFMFKAGNYSGKFVFTESGNVVLVPLQKILIERYDEETKNQESFQLTLSSVREFKFKITTPDGFQYFFSVPEHTYVRNKEDNSISVKGVKYQSSWLLKEIIAPNSEKIEIDYVKYWARVQEKTTSVIYQATGDNSIALGLNTSWIDQKGARPTEIRFPNGKISFTMDGLRSDISAIPTSEMGSAPFDSPLPAAQNDFKLNGLTLYNALNQKIKEFTFEYNYFSTVHESHNPVNSTVVDRRLKLVSLREGPLLDKSKKYTFSYNESATGGTDLPAKNSNEIDHWGYYNLVNNEKFVITPAREYFKDGTQEYYTSGADREVNTEGAKAGTLIKMVFPTGGYTAYEYESNTYYSFAHKIDKKVGGLRVFRQVSSDNVNADKNLIKTFNYNLDDGKSSGVLLEDVKYTRKIDFYYGPYNTQSTINVV